MFSIRSENCVSSFVNSFDIISVFVAEFEEPKIAISGKGLSTRAPFTTIFCFVATVCAVWSLIHMLLLGPECLLCFCLCVIFYVKNLLRKYPSNFEEISQNDPAMVLFRISWKNLIPSKTVIAMAAKLKKYWKSLKIFLSETIKPRATKFGMLLYPVGLYLVSLNYYKPGGQIVPPHRSQVLHGLYRENLKSSCT